MEQPTVDAGSMSALCAIARSLDIAYQDDTAPTTGFVDSNGLRMHWVDWGHADKPVLLFLHGATLTARTWDLVCLQLRTDYHCIALDQRGHGKTNGVHAFGVEEPCADIHGAVQGLNLRRFAVVGMSMGGNNTLAYAGEHPGAMAAVAFVDVCPTVLPAGHEDAARHDAAIARSHTFEAAVDAADRHNPRGSKDYKRYTLSFSVEPFADGFWRLRSEREKPVPVPAEQTAATMAKRREKLWSSVPKIDCPALVVHGVDSLAQSLDNLEQFRRTLPNASLIQIPGASHDVQEDQPRALAQVLKDFFVRIGY